MASTAPNSILEQIDADIFVIGEGDDTIKEVLDSKARHGSFNCISNIKVKGPHGMMSGKITPNIPRLENVPRPLYEAFPMAKYIEFLEKSGRSFETYTSKGCPASCTFCYRISGRKVRYRSVDSVIQELEFIKQTYKISRFSFEDDCFGLNREWTSEFCKKVKKLNIKFRFQAFVNALSDNRTIDMLVDAGLFGVSIGMESGSPFILKEMKKNIVIDRAEKLIATLKSRQLKFNATFIIGMPGESDESVSMTRDFLVRNGFTNNFQLFFLTPYPGTELYDSMVKNGKVKSEKEYIENLRLQNMLTINLTEYPDEKLIEWKKMIINDVMRINAPGEPQDTSVTWTRESI